MTTRHKQRPALSALTDTIEDFVRDYHPARDGDARHFAAYLAGRLAELGEQHDETHQPCALCVVTRERVAAFEARRGVA